MDPIRNLITRSGEVVLGLAQPEDAESVRLLRLEALQDSPEAFGGDYEESKQRSVASWAEKIRLGLENEQEVLSIAKAGGRLVGMSGLFRGHSKKSIHSGIIYTVYVQPEWRGIHIAEAMVRACLEWGRERGVTVARLAVVTSNLAAIRCYLRCGFSVYGVEPMSLCLDGAYLDELLMHLKLPSAINPA
jgi:RimJ/RimL family protein N-acetyltransferase